MPNLCFLWRQGKNTRLSYELGQLTLEGSEIRAEKVFLQFCPARTEPMILLAAMDICEARISTLMAVD